MNNTIKQKIKELSQYLEIPEDDITVENEDSNNKYNEYYTKNDGIYYIMDIDESTEAVASEIESLIYDVGLDAFTTYLKEQILTNYIDDDFFEDYCYNFCNLDCMEIESEPDEEYGTQLNRECIENGVISERDVIDGQYIGNQDLISDLTEKMYEQIGDDYSSYAEWFLDEFGESELYEVLKQGNFIALDIDGIAQECIDEDGFGYYISRYNRETIELETFYAYYIRD